MRKLKFISPFGMYNCGESASFDPKEAIDLVEKRKVAVYMDTTPAVSEGEKVIEKPAEKAEEPAPKKRRSLRRKKSE